MPSKDPDVRRETQRNYIARIRSALVIRDGHPYNPLAPEHGISTSYKHYGCRCEPCYEWRLKVGGETDTAWRKQNFSQRIIKDGRLYSPIAPGHGSSNSYRNYGCRCIPCSNWRQTQPSR